MLCSSLSVDVVVWWVTKDRDAHAGLWQLEAAPPKGQDRSPFKKVPARPLTAKGSIKNDMEGVSEHCAEAARWLASL